MMKMIFLNVWGAEMQDTLIGYLEEQARDTDVFCFQEATEKMKRRCADALSNYTEIFEDKFTSEVESFSQAIFVRKAIKIASYGTLMGDSPDLGLAIYVKLQVGDTHMYICNMHGKSRPADKLDNPGRLTQSRQLIDFFKDNDGPVVIGGDFNMLPETKSMKMFSQRGYRDLIQEFAIDTTRNHLSWDRHPIKMYYSDYIFLNDKAQLKSFSVPKNEVSDHLPLILEIDI